ncbi:multiple sugar transport system substrate-binding protein [Deinococcus metalli]|uniref:Multiple sugar transport system substrate-binding protein n=1 Tax=Deinococcus metalli TaxID=1141878 RepID=A0A7W8NLT1_9DEIO|nr:ABC transporter substrate-binding protein [Deinococcus metalli]MBB5375019.1 multiple sugar transport system substrate-binding protein [Deinococcus metalli]GHF32044.1 sugar ABC transporter substrate-binding protein [Deinococcus metalli]
MSNRIPFLSALALAALGSAAHAAPTTLTVFMGSQQRPEIFQPIFERFQTQNPNIRIKIETGGATSEAQNQYLTTVLAARDSTLDIFLIDVVRTATFAAANWAEPLDAYLPSKDTYLKAFLPGPISAASVNGKLYAMPAFTDAQFLYYRKDLLAKYNAKVPKTWDDLTATATKIQKGEGGSMQGFNFQGAPIEGTVCNFLELLWTGGGNVSDVTSPAAKQGLGYLVDSVKSKLSPAASAEIKTDDSRQQFQAGNVAFGLNWSYAWAHFQGNSPQPTKVKGDVGVAALPAFGKNGTATCTGGWEWGVNAFSKNKAAAVKLLQYMASSDVQKEMAVKGAYLPVRKSLYNDSAVLAANPHFGALYSIVTKARPRPVTPNYPRVSEIIRNNVSAAVAGSKTVDAALGDMKRDLDPLLK